jgi:hypothetical protein
MLHSLGLRARTLTLIGALSVLAASGTVAGVTAASAAAHPAHPAITYTTDHQLCYFIKTVGPGLKIPPAGSVTLVNQFSKFQPTINPPTIHCNPVEKILPDGQVFPITNPNAHLLCFPITVASTQPTPMVSVSNQFGTAVLQLAQPNLLCLPTWKNLTKPPNKSKPQPPGLSHYTCYPVAKVVSGGYTPPAPIMLKDEFGGPTTVQVYAVPNRLCLPTEKIVATPTGTKIYKIVPGAMHLLCFSVTPTPFKSLFDQNQFTGPGVKITLEQTDSLCLPSTKKKIG